MRTWEQHYEYLVRHYDNGCVADSAVGRRPRLVYDQAAARRLARGLCAAQGVSHDITSVKIEVWSATSLQVRCTRHTVAHFQ